MTRTIRLLPLLTVLVLLGAGQANAETIGFSYQWTVLPTSVFPGGTGSVTLAAAPDGTSSAELGSSLPAFIPGATVTTTSSATDVPDTFSTPFSMKVHLIDTGTGLFGDLSFSGTISGTLTATTSGLSATFDDPFVKTLELGNHVFTVQIDPALVSLPVPGATSPASIDARVTVANKGVVDPPNGVPEPSSLVLGATAVLGFAARRFWRRRPDKQQQAV
jgi:hypothetical protein